MGLGELRVARPGLACQALHSDPFARVAFTRSLLDILLDQNSCSYQALHVPSTLGFCPRNDL